RVSCDRRGDDLRQPAVVGRERPEPLALDDRAGVAALAGEDPEHLATGVAADRFVGNHPHELREGVWSNQRSTRIGTLVEALDKPLNPVRRGYWIQSGVGPPGCLIELGQF